MPLLKSLRVYNKVKKKNAVSRNVSMNKKALTRFNPLAPVPPKKPISAYLKWTTDNREAFKKKNPQLTQRELVTLLGQEWRKISATVKKKYEENYDKERKKYEDELKVYTDKFGPIRKKRKQYESDKKPKKIRNEDENFGENGNK